MSNEIETKKGRRWVRVLIVLVIGIGALAVFAPSLLSWTIGPGIVASALRDSVNGDVTVASVRFGWTAPQRIEGLVIDDRKGGSTIRATVEVQRSLLSLITNPMGTLDLVASASVTTKLLPDGSLALSTLAKPSAGSTAPGSSSPSPAATSQPQPLPPSLVANIRLEPSSFEIDRGTDGTVKLTGLAGTLRVAVADGSVAVDLNGTLVDAGAPGALTLHADLRNVVDRFGAATPNSALGSAKLTLSTFAMKYEGAESSINGLEASLDGTSATTPLTVNFSIASAKRAETEVRDLAGRVALGRGSKGTGGFPLTDVTGVIERGSVSVAGGAEAFSATGISADVSINSGGRASFKLAATTAVGARRGSVAGAGSFERLFNDSFEPKPAQAIGSATLTVSQAVIPSGPVQTEITELAIKLDASNAAAPVEVTVNGRGAVREIGENSAKGAVGEPTTITATLALTRNLSSAIGISYDLRDISGQVEARAIPSAIIRPFIPDLGEFKVDPARDLGPVVNLRLLAPGGTAAPLSVVVQSARLNADIQASIDPSNGSVRDGRATISATLTPELLEGTSVRAGGAVSVALSAKGLVLPRRDDTFDLDALQVDASGSVDGVLTVGGERPIALSAMRATLKTTGLAKGAAVTAGASLDGMPTTVTAELTGLNGLGTESFKQDAVNARGTIIAGPVDWTAPPAFLDSNNFKGVEYGLGSSTINVGVDGSIVRGSAIVKLLDGQQGASANLAWDEKTLHINDGSMSLQLSNRTLDSLKLSTIRLAQPASIQGALAPVEVSRADFQEGRPLIAAMSFTVRAPSLAIASAPGLEQPLTLTSLEFRGTVRPQNDISADIQGSTGLADSAGAIGSTTFQFEGSRLLDTSRQWKGSIDGKELAGSRLLTIAGVDPASVPGIAAADRGTIVLHANSDPAGAIGAQLDTAIGALRAKGASVLQSDGAILVSSADLSITLDAMKSSAFFAVEKDSQGRPLITRASAVPMTATVTEFSIPAPGADGSRHILRSKGAVKLTTGNLDLEVASLGTVRLGALDADFSLVGDGRRMTLRANSTVAQRGGAAQPLAIGAEVTDFVNANGELDWVRLSLDGVAKMQGLPVALIDVFVDGDGTLTDALGPELQTDLKATSPASSPGATFSGSARSEYMTAELGVISLDHERLEIQQASPLKVSLIPNETLRQRLLKPINPILEDIRPQKNNPIVFTVDELSMPLDGDLRTLGGHFTLTVGDVEIQRADKMLSLLKLVREDEDGLIPGNISPLDATLTDGRLTYDELIVSIGKIGDRWSQQLYFSADINLGSKPPYATAINADYPVGAIGRLATGATRFDAFFGRLDAVMAKIPLLDSNALRMRVTYSGPIEPDRELDMAFEPVLITPQGSGGPVNAILDGIFGEKGILKLPGQSNSPGGSAGGSGSGGTAGGTGGAPAEKPRDPIGGILDDLFKKKQK